MGLKILEINLPVFLLVIFSSYLLIKVLVFSINWAGLIDLAAAGLLVLSIFAILPGQFYSIISALLALKGLQSIIFNLV